MLDNKNQGLSLDSHKKGQKPFWHEPNPLVQNVSWIKLMKSINGQTLDSQALIDNE